MAELSYPPCLRSGCRSPEGHPNCKCWSDKTESQMAALGYKESGSTKGMTKNSYGQFDKPYIGGYAHGGEVSFDDIGPHHNEDCPHFASGGQVEENQEFASNPDLSLDHAIINHGLLHALTKTGHSKSEDPTRVVSDHRDAARRGRRELQTHSKNLFSQHKDHRIDSDDAHGDALGAHLDDLQANPAQALDVGGTLGMQAPTHAAALGAKTAAAMNYFQGIKPKSQQFSPLDEPTPPSKSDTAHYRRQLGVAERPQSVLQSMKDGMTSPEDLATLHAIYPKLAQAMQGHATEALIEAKTKGTEIPYKQKMTLSMMLGQPLDSTMTQPTMMAIIQANGGAQSAQAPQKGGKKSGMTATTLKAVEKADSLALTPLQKIQADDK